MSDLTKDTRTPALPEPDFVGRCRLTNVGYYHEDTVRRLLINQRRTALTDEAIEVAFQKAGGRWNGDAWVIEDADLHPFVRAITGEAE